jgi:heme-degrading monooxygenase HmoA
MIVIANRIPVNPEFNEAFEERFRNRASLVDTMEGFVSFQILRPMQESDPYIVQTIWESEAHFRAWTESEEFKQGHGKGGNPPPEGMFAGKSKMEMHEIIQKPSEVKQES